MLLLEQDTIKKKQVNKNNITKLDASNINDKYKVKKIQDSTIYARKSELDHLVGLYYLIC